MTSSPHRRFARRSFNVADLERVIAQLLNRGFANGHLVIEDEGSGLSLNIKKYLFRMGNYGIEICLAHAPWSEPYFSTLQSYCTRQGIDFFLERETPESLIKSLRIDCHKDVAKAHALVETILTEIFQIPRSVRLSTELRNCSPWNEVIDSPHQQSLSLIEGLKRLNVDVKEDTGISLQDTLLCLLLVAIQFFGTVGASYSLLLPNITDSSIHFSFVGTTFNAPVFGIVSCVLVLVGGLRMLTHTFWRPRLAEISRDKGNHKTSAPKFSTFGRIVRSPLNIFSAVVLVIAIISWSQA